MKGTLKRSWWKVSAYCIPAGWICFQLMVRLGSQFAITCLSDGSVSVDRMRWMILSGVLFFAVLAVGGLLFFRQMSRKELFLSAGVLVVLNVAGGLIAYFARRTAIGAAFAVFYSEVSQWTGFVSQGLFWLRGSSGLDGKPGSFP